MPGLASARATEFERRRQATIICAAGSGAVYGLILDMLCLDPANDELTAKIEERIAALEVFASRFLRP